MADYLELSLSSIRQAHDLVNGATLELNANLCKHLVEALIETESFLLHRFSELQDVSGKRRAALLQLYFVVKQAEILVLKCCETRNSAWPKRALALIGIKEEILDIILHLRWWESILDITIPSTGRASSSQMSERECLKSANEEFEKTLEILTTEFDSNKLQQAHYLDKQHLLQKIHELHESYPGEPGTKEHSAYLLSIQVHSLLTGKEVPPSVQSELNKYKISGFVGNGSFGLVLQVEWYGHDCALKIVDKGRPDRNEAESLQRCHHPNIVQCFRYWEEVKDEVTHVKSHILMERMPSDLADCMRAMKNRKASSSGNGSAFSNPVAVDIMLQLSKAVWHMHSKDCIHRDLKPGNVIMRLVSMKEVSELSELGFLHVKLADFGLSRGDMMSSNDAKLTRKAGSSLYRAPELSSEEYISGHNYPRKADVWSFGIMCAEILRGVRVFPEGTPLTEMLAYMRTLPEDCPDYLKFLLESCCKVEPTERPRFSEIWKLLRFAKLRSLGIIEQNYDLFSFEDSRNPRPPSQTTAALPLRPPSVQPTITPKSPVPPRPSSSKKIGFWASIFLKFGLIRRTRSQDPSAHLESSFDRPLNFLVNQVWPPENSTENIGFETPGIDVIFFEGNVGGRCTLSCRDTWLQRKKPHSWWPQDWLRHDVKGNIRVLVLEYSISDSGLEGVVEDLKTSLIFSGTWNLNHSWHRPIVLVGHSLGCTVIEALVADLDQNVQQFDHDSRKAGTANAFLNSLAGCFFYAPPCDGLAQSPDLLQYVFGGLTYSDELFRNLRVVSTETFLRFKQTRKIKLMALIEGCRTKGRFLVTENSIQDLDIEYIKLEDSNHSEVCKPVDKTHLSYEKLVQFIAACAKDRGTF